MELRQAASQKCLYRRDGTGTWYRYIPDSQRASLSSRPRTRSRRSYTGVALALTLLGYERANQILVLVKRFDSVCWPDDGEFVWWIVPEESAEKSRV